MIFVTGPEHLGLLTAKQFQGSSAALFLRPNIPIVLFSHRHVVYLKYSYTPYEAGKTPKRRWHNLDGMLHRRK